MNKPTWRRRYWGHSLQLEWEQKHNRHLGCDIEGQSFAPRLWSWSCDGGANAHHLMVSMQGRAKTLKEAKAAAEAAIPVVRAALDAVAAALVAQEVTKCLRS